MSVGMGTNSALDPIATLAQKHGVKQSSGLRPGAITSSGNVSLHASGAAADWTGTPSQMRAFFDDVRRLFGSSMDELIYTPGGKSQIKNGADFLYTGQVAVDHDDHVHTGYTGKYGPLKLSASAQASEAGVSVGSVVSGVLSGKPPWQIAAEQGAPAITDAGGVQVSGPGDVVSQLASGLASKGPRLLVEIALILGGAVLALWGVVRIAGAKPSNIAAAVPAGRAAKAAGAIK